MPVSCRWLSSRISSRCGLGPQQESGFGVDAVALGGQGRSSVGGAETDVTGAVLVGAEAVGIEHVIHKIALVGILSRRRFRAAHVRIGEVGVDVATYRRE